MAWNFPQCPVSTAFDVFRRLPVARAISPVQTGNEREDVKTLLPHLPDLPHILLFDRGYPSYDLIHHLTYHDKPYHFIFRCPASSTFKVVEDFVQSGQQQEALIWLDTASRIKTKRMGAEQKSIPLRVIRLESPDGTLSVLMTNLLNRDRYTSQSIIELYFRRWRIEEQYRDEKTHLDIETFHSQSVNGVKQELLAILVMCVISRVMMVLVTENDPDRLHSPQFKNATISLAQDAALLTAENLETAVQIFQELLVEISRVKYYKPKKPRQSFPRVSRKPINKWRQNRAKKIAVA